MTAHNFVCEPASDEITRRDRKALMVLSGLVLGFWSTVLVIVWSVWP